MYIRISDLIMPRIELQTFDKQGNNVDSMIVFYGFVSECWGERTFCIDKNFNVKIISKYGCHPDVNEGEKFYIDNISIFKINKEGKFIKQ